MLEIVPAIIGSNFTTIENKIKRLDGLTRWVHLDIMDGLFTRQTSWQTPDDLAFFAGEIKIEAHLMVQSPETVLRAWANVADRLIVHAEATDQLDEVIDFFTGQKVQFGLAFNLATPISKFNEQIRQVKLIQLMAIAEIGEQGHPFAEPVLEKIKLLRRDYPNVTIQVDGGINLDTAPLVIGAGADRLVVGSAIWQSADPVLTLKTFQNLQLPTSNF